MLWTDRRHPDHLRDCCALQECHAAGRDKAGSIVGPAYSLEAEKIGLADGVKVGNKDK